MIVGYIRQAVVLYLSDCIYVNWLGWTQCWSSWTSACLIEVVV